METTNYQPVTSNQQASDEISLKELIQKLGDWYRYLKTQWWKIAIAGIIGGAIGFVYAWMQPITYTAKTTFVVEDAKSGASLGGLASLAGQFGVDVGGGGGGSVLSGENILLYFKSESLAREVLLTKCDNDSNKTMADVYAEVYKMKKSWAQNGLLGNIDFVNIKKTGDGSRLQDSLLQQIIGSILKKQFTVVKTDKKASFIELSTTMQNEALAKTYCERIVNKAVEKYINIKTHRQKIAVDKLQARVDSIAQLLQKKTVSGASLQTSSSTMDINPLYKTRTVVATETTIRDKTMLSTIFTNAVQNLELAKLTLSQETPTIQIVDPPRYPLEKNKISRLRNAISFAFVFSIAFPVILIIKRYLTSSI